MQLKYFYRDPTDLFQKFRDGEGREDVPFDFTTRNLAAFVWVGKVPERQTKRAGVQGGAIACGQARCGY